METISLDGWTPDERFSPYPEGSRDKYAIIAPPLPSSAAIMANHRYLMKFSNPRYPAQFWSEIIAFLIGSHVGVSVPDCFYAEDPNTGQPGSLISWFYGQAVEDDTVSTGAVLAENLDDSPHIEEVPQEHSLYVPGSSYMARLIPNYDMKKGKQHNLNTLRLFIAGLRRSSGVDF